MDEKSPRETKMKIGGEIRETQTHHEPQSTTTSEGEGGGEDKSVPLRENAVDEEMDEERQRGGGVGCGGLETEGWWSICY